MIVAALGVFVFTDSPSSGDSANDSAGCASLTSYATKMNKALADFQSVVTNSGLADVFALSPDKRTDLYKDADAFHSKLKAIHPPPWAKDWHASQVEKIGLYAQFVNSSIKNDLLTSGLMFGSLIDAQGTAESVAMNSASGTCDKFAAFANQWSFIYQNGKTPTPTS